jgi:hypothetical protein
MSPWTNTVFLWRWMFRQQNRHDTKAIVPVLRSLADGGFQGPALGDLGYRGDRLAQVGERLGISGPCCTEVARADSPQ